MYHDQGSNGKGSATAAGIDLGSNSFRLLIATVSEKFFQPLVKELITVRLAQDLARTGILAEAAMARGLEALRVFALALKKRQPRTCRVCGTFALREAQNRERFLDQAREILGENIDILSGEEEAALSLKGALFFLPEVTYPLLLADVGGGSSELVFADGSKNRPSAASIPLGAVSLSEAASGTRLNNREAELALLRRQTRRILENHRQRINPPPLVEKSPLIATGGTATALAALDLGLVCYDEKAVQGWELSSIRLDELVKDLAQLSPRARSELPGLDRGRGEIILAGAAIYLELLTFFGRKSFVVSDAGLLEGILLSALPASARTPSA
jgi:exopolyphosphatase/guanosine-5'-triphosphate,3'-diphosphate pyrophosphatase